MVGQDLEVEALGQHLQEMQGHGVVGMVAQRLAQTLTQRSCVALTCKRCQRFTHRFRQAGGIWNGSGRM